MKPNGKKFAARSVFFIVCAVASLVTIGNAETAHGSFKLPIEVHWGSVLLGPGEYEFNVDTESGGQIVTVRSKDTLWSGMVMGEGVSVVQTSAEPSLKLSKSERGVYVRELCLSNLGFTLNFASPGSGKTLALQKSKNSMTASTSGLE